MPHVQEVTKRAVMVGRIITEPNPVLVALRNHGVRLAMKVPGVLRRLHDAFWIPDAHYRSGFFASGKSAAVGWQIPQPWVLDGKGTAVRLDDVLAGKWTVLHTGAHAAGADAWTALGVPSLRLVGPEFTIGPNSLLDSGAMLVAWLADRNAAAVVVRPDGFVYAAAASDRPLPAPPAQLTGRPHQRPVNSAVGETA